MRPTISESRHPRGSVCLLMPVFNERFQLAEIVRRVLSAPLPEGLTSQLVVVNDGSTDGSEQVLSDAAEQYPGRVSILHHPNRRGKGAALRTAIRHATGDYAILQDADFEYDPNDYLALLVPLVRGSADVVLGSRFLPRANRCVLPYRFAVSRRLLTVAGNLATGLNKTDVATSMAAFRLEDLKSIPIRCDHLGVNAELIVKAGKRGMKIAEIPCSFERRGSDEGRKSRALDPLRSLLTITRCGVTDDLYDDAHGHAILHRLSGAHRFNRWMADVIAPHLGQNVLEIGAGMGNLSRKLLPRERYTVSDIDPMHLSALHTFVKTRPHVDVRKVDLTKPGDFEPITDRYDSVVCLNVVEHVEDDELALSNIRDALVPGGRAVVLVPQGKWLYGSLDVVLGHYRRYTRADLAKCAEHAGLQVLEIFDFNRAAVPGWFLNARLLKRTYFGAWQLRLYDSLVWLLRGLDHWFPWHGASLIAVLEKPHADAVVQRRAA